MCGGGGARGSAPAHADEAAAFQQALPAFADEHGGAGGLGVFGAVMRAFAVQRAEVSKAVRNQSNFLAFWLLAVKGGIVVWGA